MKKQRFKLKLLLSTGILVGLILINTTCELDQESLNVNETSDNDKVSLSKKDTKSGDEILELNYVIETRTCFITENKSYSELDIASMIPRSSKQKVNLKLFVDGQISMIIEEMQVNNPIKIPHKTLPDDTPKVNKTVIENNVANFYSKSGVLLGTNQISLPVHAETVNKLLELEDNCTQEAMDKAVAKLQGSRFLSSLDDFISDARRNGARVMQEDEQFMTLRMSLNQIEPGITDEVVVLIDKIESRIAGTQIYNVKGELLMSTFFGYGPPEKPYLTAIKQQAKETLPSGAEIIVESYSKIDNIKFKLNI